MTRTNASPIAVAAAIVLLLTSACTGTDSDSNSDSAGSRDEDIPAIIDDLNDYWSQADEDLGFDYVPVPPGRVTTGADGVLCSAERIDPDEVAGNAFVDPSCDEGITVAYDPSYLDDSLARAEATLAHEWGHVIQAQAIELDLSEDPDGLPIDAELQADCFAGAWAAERAEADVERLRTDTAKAGDDGDVAIDDPHAHGTPAQRSAAFDVGLNGGPIACVDDLIDALPK